MDAEFERCFTSHVARLVALGAATCGDVELARDLAQETFLRLHRRWDTLEHRDDVGGWLTKVMSNLLIDHHRSRRSEERALERLSTRAQSVVPTTEPLQHWSAMVAGLPTRQRLIVALHYGEDRSVAEIAAVLELSPNTVKSALSKARDALRQRGGVDATGR